MRPVKYCFLFLILNLLIFEVYSTTVTPNIQNRHFPTDDGVDLIEVIDPVRHEIKPPFNTINGGDPRFSDGLTDIQNILGSLTGGKHIDVSLVGGNLTSGTGTVAFIIIAVATAIFWIIIFLIIYYAVYGKKEKEENGGYGYGSPTPSYGYGRNYISENMLTMVWNALDLFKGKYD